jgi:hypothetical protein
MIDVQPIRKHIPSKELRVLPGVAPLARQSGEAEARIVDPVSR